MKFQVSWAYPTSPHAARFGHYLRGCWVVEELRNPLPPKAVRAFPKVDKTVAEALRDELNAKEMAVT